jgi:hypothetical protein
MFQVNEHVVIVMVHCGDAIIVKVTNNMRQN